MTDERGRIGWGETAPLPGFSSESMDDATEQLTGLRFSVKQTEVPLHVEELSGVFDRWFGDRELLASVRFGMETAILNLLAEERGIHLASLIADHFADEVAREMALGVKEKMPGFGDAFYLSDQISFARVGIPGILLYTGLQHEGKPDGWSKKKLDE